MNRLVYIFIVLLLPAIKAAATVKLHSLFSDNMVIQRELPIHIFGTADQGESITVTFGNATVHAVADIKGNWSVELPAQEVCMIGQSLVVEGKTKIVLRDILIGDVWLCSGQSNMEMALGSCNDSVAIKEADYSTIRFVRIPYLCKDSPQTDMDVERLAWNICTPYSAADVLPEVSILPEESQKKWEYLLEFLYQALAAQILRSGCHNPVFSEMRY